jgi:hypothetical protein
MGQAKVVAFGLDRFIGDVVPRYRRIYLTKRCAKWWPVRCPRRLQCSLVWANRDAQKSKISTTRINSPFSM